jgi:hypothetical protein
LQWSTADGERSHSANTPAELRALVKAQEDASIDAGRTVIELVDVTSDGADIEIVAEWLELFHQRSGAMRVARSLMEGMIPSRTSAWTS